MKLKDYRAWELALILISFLVFATCLVMYLTHFPLRNYLFDLPNAEGTRQEVGKIAVDSGVVRREVEGQSEFKTITKSSPVFNEDTIVTDPDTKATVDLNDGGQIELGSGSMVKLSFENQYSLQGITGSTSVRVVKGTVTSKAGREQIVVKSSQGSRVIPKNTIQPVKVVEVKPVIRYTPPPTPAPSETVIAVNTPEAVPSPSLAPSPSAVPSAPPSPEAAPIPQVVSQAKIVSPSLNEKFSLPNFPDALKVGVRFAWKVIPADRASSIEISQVLPERVAVLSKALEVGVPTVLKASFNYPGTYEWEVKNELGLSYQPPVRGRFQILPEFTGIQVNAPLVAGEKMVNSALQNKLHKQFDLTLNWNPYPDAKSYRVQIFDSATMNKRLLQKEMKDTKYQINRNQVVNGTFYYRISAKVKNGFIAISELVPYAFSYLPPNLVLPVDQAVLPHKALVSGSLFTWRATNFTESYVFEVASDPAFTQMVKTLPVKENFYIYKVPKVGTYYWRVKSKAKNMLSSPSKVNQFTVPN